MSTASALLYELVLCTFGKALNSPLLLSLSAAGLSGGEIAGIVIVIVALLGLAVTFLLICVYCWGQSEKRKTKFK